MEVYVVDVLAGVPARVEDDPIARLGETLVAGRPAGRDEELTKKAFRALGRFVERGEVELRYDQDMDRRLGPDILKGQGMLVLEKDFRRELPARDPAEEAVGGPPGAHDLTLPIVAPSPRSFSSIRS